MSSKKKSQKVENVEIVADDNTQKRAEFVAASIAAIDIRYNFETTERNVSKHTLAVLDNFKRALSSEKFADLCVAHNVPTQFYTARDKKNAMLNIKSVEEVLNLLRTLAQGVTLDNAVANRVSFMRYAQIMLAHIGANDKRDTFSNADLRAAVAKAGYDTSTQVAQTSIFSQALLALGVAERTTDEGALNVSEKHAIRVKREHSLMGALLAIA